MNCTSKHCQFAGALNRTLKVPIFGGWLLLWQMNCISSFDIQSTAGSQQP